MQQAAASSRCTLVHFALSSFGKPAVLVCLPASLCPFSGPIPTHITGPSSLTYIKIRTSSRATTCATACHACSSSRPSGPTAWTRMQKSITIPLGKTSTWVWFVVDVMTCGVALCFTGDSEQNLSLQIEQRSQHHDCNFYVLLVCQ